MMKDQFIFFREDAKLFSFFGCPTCNSNPGNTSDFICSAPTQSLLQKWLREIHNIHVSSFEDYGKTVLLIHYYDHENSRVELWSYKGPYDTYEEALEKGLLGALKLI